MKTLNLILFIFLLPFLASSQTNFKPGYVINLKGDTIKGYIDYRGWDKTPTSISFKHDTSSHDSKQLTKNDINFFSITGVESYQKFIGTISLNIIDLDHLSYESDSTYRVDTVFFKVLQIGNNIALYSYTDQLKTRYYFGENPDYKPKELIFRIFKNPGIVEKNKDVIQEGNTFIENAYQRQLFAIANKYNSMDDELTKLFSNGNYKEDYLLKVVGKINKIKTYDSNKNTQAKVNYFVGGGLSFDSPHEQSYGGTNPSTFPLISGGINIIPKPKSEKVEIRLEVQIALSKYNSNFSVSNPTYNIFNVSLFPQIIFNVYNKEDFKIFLGGGIALSHHSYYNIDPSLNGYYTSNFSNTFLLKAGIKTSKKIAFYMNILTDYSVNTGDFSNIFKNTVNVGVLYFWGK